MTFVILPVPGPAQPDPYKNPGIVPPWLQRPRPGVGDDAGVEQLLARRLVGAFHRVPGAFIEACEGVGVEPFEFAAGERLHAQVQGAVGAWVAVREHGASEPVVREAIERGEHDHH